jgi:hypothetical protein
MTTRQILQELIPTTTQGQNTALAAALIAAVCVAFWLLHYMLNMLADNIQVRMIQGGKR